MGMPQACSVAGTGLGHFQVALKSVCAQVLEAGACAKPEKII